MEEALFARLSGHAGTAALVSDRIYPVIAPQNAVDPHITYQRISGQRIRSLSGPSGMGHPRVQVDCWGRTSTSAKAVAKQARFALDGWRGTLAGTRVGSVVLDNETDFYEPESNLHRVSLDFLILHDEEVS